MKSVFARSVFFNILLMLLCILVVGSSLAAISYDYIVREKYKMLDSTAQVVAGAASAMYTESQLDNWQLRITISSVSGATDTSIFICDLDGFVIWHSGDGYIGVYVSPRALSILKETGTYSERTNLDGYYSSKVYASATTVRDFYTGESIGYVFAASSGGIMAEMWRSYILLFLLAVCVLVIAAVPITVIMSRKQSEPLHEMAEVARAFAKGDMSVRVNERGRSDEIGELAGAINQMASSLEKAETSRREFVANVSHELKTPMTTISGFADGLLDGTIPMDRAEHYLSVISQETKRLSELVRRMLEISRTQGETVKDGHFDAAESIRRVLAGLEGKISQKKLELNLTLPEHGMTVRGDGDMVERVIYNIVDNAVKFADEGSELAVNLYKKGGKAYISVLDRGETIPPDDLPMIFERFHKSDRSRSLDRDGVGLGLYIVKSILGNMGENIWARSKNGETEFVFSLTLAE